MDLTEPDPDPDAPEPRLQRMESHFLGVSGCQISETGSSRSDNMATRDRHVDALRQLYNSVIK